MYYVDVWVRGVYGVLSWCTEKEISLGARVVVPFRKQKKVGIVVSIDQKERSFKTLPVIEVWDEEFLPLSFLKLLKKISEESFTGIEKTLSLAVPEKFFQVREPEVRECIYILQKKEEVRGVKQKEVLSLFKEIGEEQTELFLKKIASLSTLKSLVEKGFFKIEYRKLKSFIKDNQHKRPTFDLTELQQKAFDSLWKTTKPSLLFGVTGSGKTEVYKKLAKKVLKKTEKGQVLFLLPEIALTSQLIAEFYTVFGNELAIWHSKLSDGEKIQEWKRCQSGEARVLIGTRSSVFVPLPNLAISIVDEEHEWTFKNEFAPRYWIHNVLDFWKKELPEMHLVFGSATPRVESLVLCEKGDWNLVELNERVQKVELPQINMIDLRNERKKGNESPLSEFLQEELERIFMEKKQAILFLNKRGFTGTTLCQHCGHTFECPNCSFTMKMHQKGENKKFMCHICGHVEAFPEKCPKCNKEKFDFKGWGTQMLEKELKERFPEARVLRADADTITGKFDFDKLLDKFHNYEADVLIGTQMIAKGLDFEKVELVGVIQADLGLSLPDFRAEERVFQILTQVSGRAGRRKKRGEIILQSFNPKDEIFSFVKKHNSNGFLRSQIEKRKQTKMPPFSKFIKCTISDPDKNKAFNQTKSLFNIFKKAASKEETVFFAPSFFPRTHNKYHFHVFLQGEDEKKLRLIISNMLKEWKGINIKIDVNPVSLL